MAEEKILREELLGVTREVIHASLQLLCNKNVRLICINSNEEKLDESLTKIRANFPELIEVEERKGFKKIPLLLNNTVCVAYVLGAETQTTNYKTATLPEALCTNIERIISFFVRTKYIIADKLAEELVCLLKRYDLLNFLESDNTGNYTKNRICAHQKEQLVLIQTALFACTFNEISRSHYQFLKENTGSESKVLEAVEASVV